MAYVANQLSCIYTGGSGGQKWWSYMTADSLTTVETASYFSDTSKLFQAGDIIFVHVVDDVRSPTTTTDYGTYAVTAVSSGVATIANYVGGLDTQADWEETIPSTNRYILNKPIYRKDHATLLADTDISYSGTDAVVAGDIVRTRKEGFSYEVAASGASDHDVTNSEATPVKFYVLPDSTGAYPAAAFDTGSNTDTQQLQAAVTKGQDGAIFVSPDMTPDYSAISNLSEVTIIQETGNILLGGVSLSRYGYLLDHIVFQTRRAGSQSTRLYVQPPEHTLFHTEEDDGVVTSLTAFFDAYDDQGKESLTNSEVTGPHYRDGGISLYVDNSGAAGDNLVPKYSPVGLTCFNSKMAGNWWPFRPAAGLAISQKPMATVFELPQTVANAGPTFAGGGVYPTDRWRPGKVYSVGDICHEYGRVYEITTGGTSGTTPPLHDGAGGARADAWDASILTTVGTLSGGFYSGSDGGTGGGTVQYALLEQLFPTDMTNVLFLGPASNDSLREDPMIGLDDNAIQIAGTTYLKAPHKIISAKQESDGSGTEFDAGMYATLNAGMSYGYSDSAGLLVKHNSTTQLKFNNVSYAVSEIVKPDGDATVDVAGVNIVKFLDTSATNFTGFTNAEQGQVIHLLFNNSNTTMVHSGSLQIPGGSSITPGSLDGYTVVMRNASTGQVMN